MQKGVLLINGEDAYEKWGVTLQQTGLSALMTPPPMKSVIESNFRRKPGKVMINDAQYDARELTLTIQITARSEDEFMEKYGAFCSEVLAKGELTLWTKYQPDVLYRFFYLSCSQFSEWVSQYAAFSLKLSEPDPTNREM